MTNPIKILDEIQKEERNQQPSPEACPYAHQRFGILWDCQLKDNDCKHQQSFGYNHYYCARELRRKA